MAFLYWQVEQEMGCPREIVIWNYFDHEHVVGTHYKHYVSVKIIAERDGWCFSERFFNLPYLGLALRTLNFLYLESAHAMKSFHLMALGLKLEQEFSFQDLEPEHCKVIVKNRVEVPWVFTLLQPIFAKLMRRWFYSTWDEDHGMRLRRWKVWKLGFENFKGIDYINEKTVKPADRGQVARFYPIELPVPKSTSISKHGYRRIFASSVEVG